MEHSFTKATPRLAKKKHANSMKTFPIVATMFAGVAFLSPASAETITRHQLLTTCETKSKTVAYVHFGRETNIPKNTVLEQIDKGLADEDAVLQNRKLVDGIYASPRPVGLHDWNDEAMRSCIASQMGNLSMEDSGGLLLWRVVKNWERTAATIGHKGTVTFEVFVKPDSTIGEVKILSSSGFKDLDNAAVAEVKRWQWRAEVRDGKFYPMTVRESLTASGPPGEH